MNKISFCAATLLAGVGFTIMSDCAMGFGLSGLTNSQGGATVNTAEIKASVLVSIQALVAAEAKYLEAVGNKDEAAKASLLAEKLSKGTLGADDITQVTTLSSTLTANIDAKKGNATKFSADGKKLAQAGLAFHVTGTLAGLVAAKQIKSALNSRSPDTLMALSELRSFPAMIVGWTKATGSVLQYLKDSGVNVSDAKKSIDSAMKDNS